MTVIDLDAARAARREAMGGAPTARIGGEDFELPSEMPFEAIEMLGPLKGLDTNDEGNAGEVAGALFGIFQLLLGDRYPAFKAHRPSIQDLMVLFEGIMKEYGVDLGKLAASSTSSETTGEPSNPASSASTA